MNVGETKRAFCWLTAFCCTCWAEWSSFSRHDNSIAPTRRKGHNNNTKTEEDADTKRKLEITNLHKGAGVGSVGVHDGMRSRESESCGLLRPTGDVSQELNTGDVSQELNTWVGDRPIYWAIILQSVPISYTWNKRRTVYLPLFMPTGVFMPP